MGHATDSITVEDVHLTYPSEGDGVPALRGVDLTVRAGEVVCLYGASGSGKSTLLLAIGALEVPQRGSVTVAGRQVVGMADAERTDLRLRTVGMVFQEHNLVAQFTARRTSRSFSGAKATLHRASRRGNCLMR